MTRTLLRSCPICGWKSLPIVYGYPTSDMFERKDIVLGGCIIDPMYPDRSCSNCDWQGQEWAVLAPLPYRVWILEDPSGENRPIGLVTERFDSIIERFFLGGWEDPTSTRSYQQWLKSVGQPIVWCAMASDLDPECFPHFRSGQTWSSQLELEAMGFKRLDQKAPRFRFEGPAWQPKGGAN